MGESLPASVIMSLEGRPVAEDAEGAATEMR